MTYLTDLVDTISMEIDDLNEKLDKIKVEIAERDHVLSVLIAELEWQDEEEEQLADEGDEISTLLDKMLDEASEYPTDEFEAVPDDADKRDGRKRGPDRPLYYNGVSSDEVVGVARRVFADRPFTLLQLQNMTHLQFGSTDLDAKGAVKALVNRGVEQGKLVPALVSDSGDALETFYVVDPGRDDTPGAVLNSLHPAIREAVMPAVKAGWVPTAHGKARRFVKFVQPSSTSSAYSYYGLGYGYQTWGSEDEEDDRPWRLSDTDEDTDKEVRFLSTLEPTSTGWLARLHDRMDKVGAPHAEVEVVQGELVTEEETEALKVAETVIATAAAVRKANEEAAF